MLRPSGVALRLPPAEERSVAEINIGDPAPDFQLPVPGNEEIRLSDFRGQRHVVLAFYPFDWSPG